jgi:hypothetical protein
MHSVRPRSGRAALGRGDLHLQNLRGSEAPVMIWSRNGSLSGQHLLSPAHSNFLSDWPALAILDSRTNGFSWRRCRERAGQGDPIRSLARSHACAFGRAMFPALLGPATRPHPRRAEGVPGLGVSSRALMGHPCRMIRRMRYGTSSSRERHDDRGGPSSDTT